MSLKQIYRVRQGDNNALGDAILPLTPGAPLMIMKNVNQELGNTQDTALN